MSNVQQAAQQGTQVSTIKSFFQKDSVSKRFEEILGKKASSFIASVVQVTSNNKLLIKADPLTIYNAALIAATLDLPINQNLGFAWIVPYKGSAQFQMGYKGYIQLAQRTGQYKSINVIEVYENQFKSFNALTEELVADFGVFGQGEIVGYAAYFELLNGFRKTVYWPSEKVLSHAKRYSESFKSSFSPWNDKDQKHAMAKKTVLKNMLSTWGILSVEMNTAIKADTSVVKNADTQEFLYNDVPEEEIHQYEDVTDQLTKEEERMQKLITGKSIEELNALRLTIPADKVEIFDRIVGVYLGSQGASASPQEQKPKAEPKPSKPVAKAKEEAPATSMSFGAFKEMIDQAAAEMGDAIYIESFKKAPTCDTEEKKQYVAEVVAKLNQQEQ